MERSCVGRVWIFLLLGVILVVLGLVVIGVYFNVHMTTSSTDYTEIFPIYINAAMVGGFDLFVYSLINCILQLLKFHFTGKIMKLCYI